MADLSHIKLLQLFYELKQKFPAVPDPVITACINKAKYQRALSEAYLSHEQIQRTGVSSKSTPNLCRLSRAAEHLSNMGDKSKPKGSVPRKLSADFPVNSALHHLLHQSSAPILAVSTARLALTPLDAESNPEYTRSVSSPVAGNQTPTPEPRKKVFVDVEPSPHFLLPPTLYSPDIDLTSPLPLTPAHSPRSPLAGTRRGTTSVSLSVNPEGHAQSPGHVTYASTSFDPSGYHSKLSISISPYGGSVSAVRTRPSTSVSSTPSPSAAAKSLVPYHEQPSISFSRPENRELVLQQLERRERLERVLGEEKRQVSILKEVIDKLCKELNEWKLKQAEERLQIQTPPEQQELEALREENWRLRMDCDRMAQKVDSYPGGVPLGETDATKYPQVQQPPTPSPSRPNVLPLARTISVPGEEENWNCSVCTFSNHPALLTCEQCDMPRNARGGNSVLRGCYCHGETGVCLTPVSSSDITIHVTHRHLAAHSPFMDFSLSESGHTARIPS